MSKIKALDFLFNQYTSFDLPIIKREDPLFEKRVEQLLDKITKVSKKKNIPLSIKWNEVADFADQLRLGK